jgi:hypothetical protein
MPLSGTDREMAEQVKGYLNELIDVRHNTQLIPALVLIQGFLDECQDLEKLAKAGGGLMEPGQVWMEPGQVWTVFDGKLWKEAGGDVGNNSQFWKPARILRTYAREDSLVFRGKEMNYDVEFLHDGRESKGHLEPFDHPHRRRCPELER